MRAYRHLPAALLTAFVLLAQQAAAETINIVAFGASTTAGSNVGRGEDYPSRLEATLKARGQDVKVTNAGKTGDMIAGALARLDKDIPPGAHIAIVEIGANDRREGYDASYIQAGLDRIVDRLRERNVQVLVANYLDVSGGSVARGTYFVPIDVSRIAMNFRVADDPYFHLTAPAYNALAMKLAPAVEELIKRVREHARQ